MNMTAEKRASSNMRRLRKGDRFVEIVRGEEVTLEVTGWPETIDEGIVRIPVLDIENGQRSSRRRYTATDRVTLV